MYNYSYAAATNFITDRVFQEIDHFGDLDVDGKIIVNLDVM
jgi:hypothetical protein